MTKQTLTFVSHTHWDREWYRTHEQFRYELVQLLDGLLDMLEEEDKENLQELLQFDEESAGGIMVGEFVAVPEGVTVGEAIEKLREMARAAGIVE